MLQRAATSLCRQSPSDCLGTNGVEVDQCNDTDRHVEKDIIGFRAAMTDAAWEGVDRLLQPLNPRSTVLDGRAMFRDLALVRRSRLGALNATRRFRMSWKQWTTPRSSACRRPLRREGGEPQAPPA